MAGDVVDITDSMYEPNLFQLKVKSSKVILLETHILLVLETILNSFS